MAWDRMMARFRTMVAQPSVPGELSPGPPAAHRDVRSGSLRAAIFGLNDGLVSNVSLVLGTFGAHPGGAVIRLAGLAGLFGGSFSMAAGEYISMSGQREVFERELSLEREELFNQPEVERRELVGIYMRRGVSEDIANELASELMSDPHLALATHAREELGIDPGALGSPVRAAMSSFFTFAFGALIPLLPFLTGSSSNTAAYISIGITAFCALAIGAGLSLFTLRAPLFSAFRSLGICVLAGGITFLIGSLIGASGTG